MEEAIAAPIDRLEPAAQIVPAGDRVDRFVLDDLFQNSSGSIPCQPAQLEEAGVEPGLEGILELGVERLQPGIARGRAQQVGAHGEQAPGALGRKVEQVDQLEAG